MRARMLRRTIHALLLVSVAWGSHLDSARAKGQPAEAPKAAAEILRPGLEWLQRAHLARSRGEEAKQKSAALRAVSEFASVSKADPKDPQPVFLAVQAAALCADPEKARTWLARYEQVSPSGEQDPELHYLRAQVALFSSARPDLAVDALRRMFTINPAHRAPARDQLYYDALLAHGAALVHQGAFEKGIDRFQRAQELAHSNRWSHKDLAARGNIAVALRRALRMSEALELLGKLISENPRNVQWHWERALNEAAQLKYAEAIKSYRKVENLRKTADADSVAARETAQVYLRLGNCLRNSVTARMPKKVWEGRLSEAQMHLEKYVALEPKDARGHRWLGTYWLENRDQPHRAIPHYQRAHTLDPDCATSLRNLVQIYARHGPQAGTGESDATWEKQRAAYAKDLAEGEQRRAAALQAREKRLGRGVTGCE